MPGAHAAQAAACGEGAWLPGPQKEQEQEQAAPLPGEKVPAGQREQADDFANIIIRAPTARSALRVNGPVQCEQGLKDSLVDPPHDGKPPTALLMTMPASD